MGWWVGGVDWWMGWIGGLVWTGGLVVWWSGSLQLGAWKVCKSILARATAMGRRISITVIIIIIISIFRIIIIRIIIMSSLRAFRRARDGEAQGRVDSSVGSGFDGLMRRSK